MADASFDELAQGPTLEEETIALQMERASSSVQREGPKYRGGFSTSICSLFSDTNRHNDCCSLALCGILSTDRSRYLLNQEMPPWFSRIVFHIILPFGLFFADREVVAKIKKKKMEDVCTGADHETELSNLNAIHAALLLTLGIILIAIFFSSRLKRSKFRAKLMSRISEQQLQMENASERQDELSLQQPSIRLSPDQLQSQTEMIDANGAFACCYRAPDRVFASPDHSGGSPETEQPDEYICSCIWRALAACCCASCCGCWCQCCGMCAAGQEEREVAALVPKEKLLMDYVTFEPFGSYFPSIEDLRQKQEGSFFLHCCTLSQLSFNILKGAAIVLACAFIFSLTDIDANFTLENMLVLLATLFQALVVLYFVHWKWHRFDLSLDAVIKYFASGFVIATSLAMVIEALISLVIGFIIFVLFMIAMISELSLSERLEEDWVRDPTAAMKELIKENTWLFVLFMFLNAFVVAALTEEMCKYFSFWMVEHPDLMTDSIPSEGELNYVVDATGGGDNEKEGILVGATTKDIGNIVAPQLRYPKKGLHSTGSGITIAMVAAAMGFACCENVGYVFSSSKVEEELLILLVRSVLPVHAIAAAIQSIGVCRRDLEGDKSFKLGRIILPAVLLHGSFDFILMVIPTLEAISHLEDTDDSTAKKEEECRAAKICKKYANSSEVEDLIDRLHCEDNGSDSPSWIDIFGLALAVVVMLSFIVYYVVQSRAQKRRLNDKDRAREYDELHDADVAVV